MKKYVYNSYSTICVDFYFYDVVELFYVGNTERLRAAYIVHVAYSYFNYTILSYLHAPSKCLKCTVFPTCQRNRDTGPADTYETHAKCVLKNFKIHLKVKTRQYEK